MARTRKRAAKDEILESRERAAAKPRSRKTAPLSDALQELASQHNLVTADQLLPAEEPAALEAILESRQAKPTDWVQRVERPVFGPTPDFFAAWSDRQAGIRVLKKTASEGGIKKSISTIQFADNHRPVREEKDELEKAGFSYKPQTRLWERRGEFGAPLGDNVIDAIHISEQMSKRRNAGKDGAER